MRTLHSFLLFCVLVPFPALSQHFNESLYQFQLKNPQEKIFLHFDKDGYVAGETIWFKAYLFHNSLPGLISTNFFIQLQDEQGRLIETKKYPVNAASVSGHLELNDSLPPGLYSIHAFTPSTYNFVAPELAYRKNFHLAGKSYAAPDRKGQNKIALQFFPEGGQLIHGITSLMAFKATDADGRPVDFTGWIKTTDGFTIPIKSTHHGMGKVNFRPDASKQYFVTLNNRQDSFPIPAIQRSGVLLHVEDEKDGKQFTITRGNQDKSNYQQLMIVAQIHNQVVYEQEIDFEGYPSIKGHLLTDKLASGILHLTVFNKDGIPLAERLSFVDNREYGSNTAVNVVKKDLDRRSENIIEIIDLDSLQQSLSLSVTDISAGDLHNRESIISRFLLTADLEGFIQDPAAYFESPYDSVKQGLDLIMLTHGWRRFNWTKILNKDIHAGVMNDPYLLTLKGLVRDEKERPVNGGSLNLFIESEDSTTQNYELKVGGNGSFTLDSLLFYGQAKLHYTYFLNGRQKQVILSVDSSSLDSIPLIQALPSGWAGVYQISKEEADRRFSFSHPEQQGIKTLEPVILETSTVNSPLDQINEKYTTGAFRSRAKVNIDNINSPTPNKTINPLDYAMNNIRLLEVQGGRLVNNRTMSLMSGEKWTVAVFLDEVPVDLSVLKTYRMDEIALIKYYDPGFVGAGSGGPGGALAVYTKQQKSAPKNQRMEYFLYKGYSVTKEFYQPDYSKTAQANELPDLRSTLYWNPDIFLDEENQRFQVRFFNNDYSKKLRLVLEGFAANGKLIHIDKILE